MGRTFLTEILPKLVKEQRVMSYLSIITCVQLSIFIYKRLFLLVCSVSLSSDSPIIVSSVWPFGRVKLILEMTEVVDHGSKFSSA